jgi:hypothetical protein
MFSLKINNKYKLHSFKYIENILLSKKNTHGAIIKHMHLEYINNLKKNIPDSIITIKQIDNDKIHIYENKEHIFEWMIETQVFE